MLSCEQLAIERGGIELFNGLSFTLYPGALLLLHGPNGVGKTSLIKALAGMLPTSEGRILWEGTPIRQQDDYWKHCQYLGHLNGMWPKLSVMQNLSFWAKQHDAETAIPAAIHLWQLQHVLEQPYARLSQGWKRRVANARLLLSPGKIWLLDEPMANLDKEGAYMLEAIVQSRCQQGGTVIMSSHIDVDIPGQVVINIQDFQP